MDAATQVRYFRRLLKYVIRNKGLLGMAVLMGTIGFAVTFVFPWVIGSLLDDVIAPGHGPNAAPVADRLRWLMVLLGISVVTALLFAVSGFGRGHYTMKLGNRIATQIRKDLFDHLQKLSLYFYSKERTGGIVWRVMHEVYGVVNLLYAGGLLAFFDLLQLAIAITLMMMISVKLTLAVLIILPCYVITFKFFNPRVVETSDRVNRHIGQMSGNVQEQLSAIALVKSYAAEDRESARFSKDNEEHFNLVVKQSRVGHAVGAVSEALIHSGTAIIVGLGGYLALTQADNITVGGFTRFIGYVGILYGPVKRFADLTMVYNNSLASIRRVFRVFDINPKIVEKPDAVATPPQRGDVTLENVRFYYGEACDETRMRLDEDEPEDSPYLIRKAEAEAAEQANPRWVLNGIDFRIHAGERIALVGSSGCGKSTLAALIPRLYDVCEGSIRIDGVDVRDYTLKALRTSIATVAQDSFLFSGSIRDNIAYGRPDATEAEVIAAARAANAHNFIMDTPDGYDTLLGERGINLSGGQRQRISIARAILKDPKLLILDEATSALDTESEALVQEALERLMDGRTCLVIAHRLSTVRNADRIIALDRGRIVEAGRHEELIERNGLYARLVRQQFGHHKVPKPKQKQKHHCTCATCRAEEAELETQFA